MSFRPSPWGMGEECRSSPWPGTGFYHSPLPPGSGCKPSPSPQGGGIENLSLPPGSRIWGQGEGSGYAGRVSSEPRRANSAAPKDILSSDFVEIEIHAPAQGEGIRGKGGRSELPPLGQGKGMRFSPWAREKDQGEGAGRGNHIPLPDPPPGPGKGLTPSPWPRE